MSDWPETRESLILRVKDPEDQLAWSELIAVYRPVVCRMARARGLQHADAEDLAQNVFASVARAIESWQPIDGGPRFRNWLARISRNAILNALTRLRPDAAAGTSSVAEVLDEIPAGSTEPTDEDLKLDRILQRESRLEAIRWAANEIQSEFTETTWSIFHATAMEGRAAAQVAATYKRSIGAVYAARCRVAARLRQKLEELTDLWRII
ncbi:MAG: sigma-70 family RNA polymerase sigma factor [Planctomycetaceae bacterium]|nr:sigma-70 family RNA polymerase sigma factor [Planctomycetaceae bacterium]